MAIVIKGLDEALKGIEKKGDKAVKAVKSVLGDEATFIEERSINDAPSSFGGQPLSIKQRIDSVVVPGSKGLAYNIGLQTESKKFEIEAWLEFGTGISAEQLLSGREYTDDITKLAYDKFFRTGTGTIPAKPYLFPNFFIVRSRIVENIKKEIEKNIK